MNALAATLGFAVLGLMFQPLMVFSLASLGLVTMRRGPREGVLILAGVGLFMLVMVLSVARDIWPMVLVIGLLWVLVWLLAVVYRVAARPALMIQAAGILSLLLVVGFYLAVPEPESYWQDVLAVVLKSAFEQAEVAFSADELQELVQRLAPVMTGGIAGLLGIVLIVALLLARWWQAMLFNPGGFRQEFHDLRLGRLAALVMISLVAFSLLGRFAMATDLATVVWILFLFQGLAILHSLVLQLGMNIGWLVGVYMLLALMPHLLSPMLSGLGFVDTWFDFRRRVVKKG